MIVPDKAIKYILFQRTAYLYFPSSLLYRVINKLVREIFHSSLYKTCIQVEGLIRKNKIKKLYILDMQNEYNSIKKFLPPSCKSVLDIGCGIAGINLFLHDHYKHNINFYLLDREQTDQHIYYGFNKRGSFYNSLSVAKEFLTLNGILDSNIFLLQANPQNSINLDEEIDLVVSFISWGYHYPISTYLDEVHSILKKSGILIVDVRKNTDGYSQLKNKFDQCRVISEHSKGLRIYCIK